MLGPVGELVAKALGEGPIGIEPNDVGDHSPYASPPSNRRMTPIRSRARAASPGKRTRFPPSEPVQHSGSTSDGSLSRPASHFLP